MGTLDDIDHLRNWRIHSVAYLLQNQFRLAKGKGSCWCIPYCRGNNYTTYFLHQLIVWRSNYVNISWNPSPTVCYAIEKFPHVLWHNVDITNFLDIIKFVMDVIGTDNLLLTHQFSLQPKCWRKVTFEDIILYFYCIIIIPPFIVLFLLSEMSLMYLVM